MQHVRWRLVVAVSGSQRSFRDHHLVGRARIAEAGALLNVHVHR